MARKTWPITVWWCPVDHQPRTPVYCKEHMDDGTECGFEDLLIDSISYTVRGVHIDIKGVDDGE